MEKLKRFIHRLRYLYRRQPEIVVVQPLRRHNPEPQKFEMKGLILDTAKEERKICHSGSSPHINIPIPWELELKPPFRVHLFQTNKRGILIEEILEND